MLKVREDIDLDNLLKLGFEKLTYVFETVYRYNCKSKDKVMANIIIGQDRILHFNNNTVYNEMDNVLLDLFEQGMLKKDGQ